MTRARMIEDTTGTGVMRPEDGSQTWPAPYRLTVEVEEIKAGDQWLDGKQEIEAQVALSDDSVGWRAVNDQLPLVLELGVGRFFECWMSDVSGRLIARTGHALRRPL
jgi:hypothetical protein